MTRVRVLVTLGIVLLLAGGSLTIVALGWLGSHAVSPDGDSFKNHAMAQFDAMIGGLVVILGLAAGAVGTVIWRGAHPKL